MDDFLDQLTYFLTNLGVAAADILGDGDLGRLSAAFYFIRSKRRSHRIIALLYSGLDCGCGGSWCRHSISVGLSMKS